MKACRAYGSRAAGEVGITKSMARSKVTRPCLGVQGLVWCVSPCTVIAVPGCTVRSLYALIIVREIS